MGRGGGGTVRRRGRWRGREEDQGRFCTRKYAIASWLLKTPATGKCISWTHHSVQTILRAAALRQTIKLATSTSHNMLALGQPAPELKIQQQALCRIATKISNFQSLV